MIPQEYIYELVQAQRHGGRGAELCAAAPPRAHLLGPVPVPQRKNAFVPTSIRTRSRSTASAAARAGTSSPSSRDQQCRLCRGRQILAARAACRCPRRTTRSGGCAAASPPSTRTRALFLPVPSTRSRAKPARRYWVAERGLSAATIRRFGLGYAPDGFHAMRDHPARPRLFRGGDARLRACQAQREGQFVRRVSATA